MWGNIFWGGKKYTITLWVMMKRVVYEFLNTKYKGVLITHQRFSLHDRITEKFVTDSYESVMEFTYYYSGKDRRYHLNNLLLSHVRRYISDIHPFDVEIYVLEWCRDKSVRTVEM